MRIRSTYENELQQIQDQMLVMASMVDRQIDRSIQALKNRDLDESRRIVADDLQINKIRFDIEELCIQIIATQQPMASDLRAIVAVLNIITDLERMGDHAEGIAKISLMIGDEPLLKPLIDVPRMADKARDMLRRTMDAFVERDAEAAKRIAEEDDQVDALYDQVYRELLTFMLSEPSNITRATYLLWVAHNLERIADRVTNICERIVFLVTGRMQEMNVSKY
ncbi:MAG: phosphate signaling complex protein PhoU [Chloroflexi bacterium]|nr:phosphate signaling complex protein PhoU [Chloroflexota bacterium]